MDSQMEMLNIDLLQVEGLIYFSFPKLKHQSGKWLLPAIGKFTVLFMYRVDMLVKKTGGVSLRKEVTFKRYSQKGNSGSARICYISNILCTLTFEHKHT